MRRSLSLLAVSALSLGTLAAAPAHAQLLLASSTIAPPVSSLFVPPAHDELTAAMDAAAQAAPFEANPISLDVHDGALKVDGFTAKLKVDAEIERAAYVSLFVPGTGTVVVSLVPTPGSKLVPGAFHGNRLQFSVAGRDFAVVSSTPMMDRDAYVRLDASTAELSGQPFLGSGTFATINQPGPFMAGGKLFASRPGAAEEQESQPVAARENSAE